jgi:hypothetical protein
MSSDDGRAMRVLKRTVIALSVAAMVVALHAWKAHAVEPLDLSDARISTTVGDLMGPVFDGNDISQWSSGEGDLSLDPANILIEFTEAVTVGSVGVVTNDRKGFIRLTDVEVYAAVDDGWALLGKVDGSDVDRFERGSELITNRPDDEFHLVRFEIELLPAQVDLLRLRIMGNQRDGNDFANIHQIRLYPPAPGVEPSPLTAAPVDEGEAEALFVQAAAGRVAMTETVEFDSAKGYLGYVQSFIDTMLEKGIDIYGATHSPMLVSILLLEEQAHPGEALPPIDGQRQNDRALFGGNLQHDVPLLEAMLHTSAITGDDTYRQAAHDYLDYFLHNCANTPTGLWPWGEHAHWDFYTDSPGHYGLDELRYHEYLGAPSADFWEYAWQIRPEAVIAHADGLINHVVNLDTFEFCRHADVMRPLPEPRPAGLAVNDFPRHGGFFIHTWAFAYSRTADAKYLDWIDRMLDHHDNSRLESGMLPGRSEARAGTPPTASSGSTFSCALSMLDSVPLLGDTETARRVDRDGRAYMEVIAGRTGFANRVPSFTSHYGAGALAGDVMMYVHGYRLTGDERFIQTARAVAERYAGIEEIPQVRNTTAQVFGSVVNLMLDVYELDGEQMWLDAAERYAREAIERLYYNGLFRGATELWYYDSELWVSNLVYALVRLHSVVEQTEHSVPFTAFQR